MGDFLPVPSVSTPFILFQSPFTTKRDPTWWLQPGSHSDGSWDEKWR